MVVAAQMYYYPRRDLEIQTWLDTNGYNCPWLAIDDMLELFGGGHPNLYTVDGNCELTDADVLLIFYGYFEWAVSNCIEAVF